MHARRHGHRRLVDPCALPVPEAIHDPPQRHIHPSLIVLLLVASLAGWLLQVQLGLPEATAHRVLRNLKALGIVEPIIKVPQRRMKRSGPMPTIWGLNGHCGDEEVARAMTLHYRTLSPKCRAAEKAAQTILDEFTEDRPMEIKYGDIMLRVKAMKIPYSGLDIADLTAQYLHEKGFKIWR